MLEQFMRLSSQKSFAPCLLSQQDYMTGSSVWHKDLRLQIATRCDHCRQICSAQHGAPRPQSLLPVSYTCRIADTHLMTCRRIFHVT